MNGPAASRVSFVFASALCTWAISVAISVLSTGRRQSHAQSHASKNPQLAGASFGERTPELVKLVCGDPPHAHPFCGCLGSTGGEL